MAKEPGKLKMKLSYAAGDIYGGGSFLIFSMLFMNFLVLVEGLPVVATSVIVFIGKLWDAITDPLMGRISDLTPLALRAAAHLLFNRHTAGVRFVYHDVLLVRHGEHRRPRSSITRSRTCSSARRLQS